MSGQNHKIENASKKSSGHTASYSGVFFSFKPDIGVNTPEIKLSPKVGELNKVHKSMRDVR